MTTIIRAGSAHDFLALVPALVGYRPARSVLCVAFSGNRTGGVLRHDLPADPESADALVSTMVGTMCRLAEADAVVPIVYTDREFAEDGGMPHRDLLEAIVRRAEEAGFLVRDALCVAADAWGSLLDDDLPSGGRELSLVAESALAARAEEHGPVADSPSTLARLPEPDPLVSGEIARLLGELDSPVDGADEVVECERRRAALDELERELGDALDPVVAAEQLARGEIASPAGLAWLVHLLDRPMFRDAVLLQVAFGAVIGELALDSAEDAALRARDADASLEELMRREFDEADAESVDAFLTRLLLGQAAARPERRRIERALETLTVATANAPVSHRAGALCVAAWLSWALGRGSAAGALIELALESDAEHGMSQVLARLFGSGTLPEWAFQPPADAAWERRTGQ
ncbi:hypothetical protein AVP42_01197 [Agromyces sp. NDB4Y10]|uniref:DUF4192 family protein n=1 Tax=Agromyces sp. NDB4Y10 TaxID=1775951 RepID=UPI0007B2F667|nr:DUF4192 family protein [Agromyces sp. NDB4Y10]KZE94201.1 hypothetical protein AVP42_01197 [Agromyces sp. NDB4Y10]